MLRCVPWSHGLTKQEYLLLSVSEYKNIYQIIRVYYTRTQLVFLRLILLTRLGIERLALDEETMGQAVKLLAENFSYLGWEWCLQGALLDEIVQNTACCKALPGICSTDDTDQYCYHYYYYCYYIPGGKPGGGWLKSSDEGRTGVPPGGGGNWAWGGPAGNPPDCAVGGRGASTSTVVLIYQFS